MRIRWWPRSIRSQMLAGLVLLEALSLGLYAVLLIQQQTREVYQHVLQRLTHHAASLAVETRDALQAGRPDLARLSVRMVGAAPDVAMARITDPAGNMLFTSQGKPESSNLEIIERAQIRRIHDRQPHFFNGAEGSKECVQAIYADGNLLGYVWVEDDQSWTNEQLITVLHGTIVFGIIWIIASVLLVLLTAKSITKPLAILHRGTRALMGGPESGNNFPLPVTVENEVGDLIETFNRMVASLAEQREGLNDTLSLLDSMLANAPIGLTFFDANCRIVRVNRVFAEMTGQALSSHLGRTLPDLLPLPAAQALESTVMRVFTEEAPVRNLELSGGGHRLGRPWTWLVSAYPVRTTSHQVRWVGVIALDATERKLSEEALRKAEKLAVTGRLAASIAHEINNPLEAITNLIFLLRNFSKLDNSAQNYVAMAEYEVRRIAEITQQTLRFYRQSTLPTRARMADLLDSVLSLYQGRLNGQNVHVERDYDPELTVFCFAGEIRQVIANLVGNALDAMASGGRLSVRAHRSRNWSGDDQPGIRFTVADSGTGMAKDVKDRIFEAFFTTKEATGTGLGLWISQEIIAKHHGRFLVRSRPAEHARPEAGQISGTVFEIFIPDDEGLAVTEKSAASASTSA